MKENFAVSLHTIQLPAVSEPESAADAATHVLASELRILLGRMKRRLREAADPGDLTPSQIAVLLRLEKEGPMTTSQLAKIEGVRPQSMGATLSGLEAVQAVQGQPDPQDGRQTLISLTPACREMLLNGRAAREDWLFRTIRAQLSSEEEALLAQSVELLKRIADS